MGDVRFEEPYQRIRQASDRGRAIADMRDADLVAALGGASREPDPLVANVIATALQNRVAQLHVVLDNLGEGVILLNAEGDCVSANPAMGQIVRRAPSELLGKALHPIVHRSCAQGDSCPLVRAPHEPAFSFQVDDDEFDTADRGRAPVAYTVTGVSRDGEPAGAVLVVRDMAEHHQAVLALARLAVLLDASTDAVYTKSPSGTITSWNRGAERLYGYSATEAIGKHVSMLHPPGAQGELRLILELVIRQGVPITFETRRIRKDGSAVDVSLSVSPVTTEGRVEGALVVARDISTQRREQDLVARVLDAAPQAMIGAAEDGRIVIANRRAQRLFGYARDELLMRTVEDLVPQKLRAAHVVHRSIFVGDPHERPMGAGLDLWAVRKDGTEVPVEVSLSPVKTESGLITVAAIRERDPPGIV